MLRLSSNMTLIFRIALPCLYVTFFTLFVLSVFFVDTSLPLLSNPIFKAITLGTYLSFLLLLYFTVLRLLRVEYRGETMFVTNYFKSESVLLADVAGFKSYDFGICLVVRMQLQRKSRWGRNIYFLAKRSNYATFQQNYYS